MGFRRWISTYDGALGFSQETKAVAGNVGRGLKSVTYDPVKKFAGHTLGTTGKVLLAGAAVAGGLYAASSIVNSMRSKREYHEPEKRSDPMDMPMDMPMGMGEPTLMGMPLVEGAHAQRVKAGRGQLSTGVDASSPGMEQDGRSTVDGRPIEDLGAIR